PLVSLLLVLVLALAVLPSALSLPQSNPSTTLEYAPVPPDDSSNPPPNDGNLSSLGLATSGSLGVGEDGGALGVGGGAGASGAGKNPSTKRCVGRPPRQTEDPMSPPCVAYFNGDNFGATYSGVTASEIRMLFYYGQHN